MYRTGLWLNGQSQKPQDLSYYQVYNPSDGRLVSEAASASIEDTMIAVSQAAAAFGDWSQQSPNTRRDILLKAGDILSARKDEFIERMHNETGASRYWAKLNCDLAAEFFRDAALLTNQIRGEVIPVNKENTLSMSIRQPLGICLAIAPWNSPVILASRAIAAPLACGNCVILKASELCPATHFLLGEILTEAGLPPGVLSVLTNPIEEAPSIISTLIEHPAVRHINFTGSTRVGKIIAEMSARKLKPCLLELGGKAPVLVMEDADLELAAESIVFGAFSNSGQVCMSTERVLVSDKVAEQLLELINQKLEQQAQSESSQIISEQALNHIQQLITDAEAKGANILLDGRTGSLEMKPTIIDRVSSSMGLYNEESFGPLICFIRVSDDEEAISIANDTDYGLSSAIFSKDISRAMQVMSRLEIGMCHINSPTLYDEPHVPFGGTKQSGYGRFGGQSSINEFTDLRWVTVNMNNEYSPWKP